MAKDQSPPASVTITAIFVLFMTAWNAIRIFAVLSNWQVLNEFGGKPIYILLTGIIWVLSGAWLIRLIVIQRRSAIRMGFIIAIAYFSWYWSDRLLIQQSPAPNGIFSLLVSTILLISFSIVMVTPASKAFLNKE